jgi:hypothetical protein
MKKLLDETPDNLTRALLEAGRSHRPPPGNQAKVLLAMGAGAGVGLFSSKAFAWLSTSAGKLTLLGVTLGIAGAVVVALPPRDAVPRDAVPLAAVDPAGVAPQVVAAQPAAAQSNEARLDQHSIIVPAPVAGASSELRVSSATSSRVTTSVSALREDAPASSVRQRRTSAARKRTATRRDDASQQLVKQAEGPLPAAPASPPAVGALVDARAGAAADSRPGAAADPPGAVEGPEERVSGLESEIQLVDAMRGAAQRNDTSALRRLVASYRGAFPTGQLRQEVSELALRALPAAH